MKNHYSLLVKHISPYSVVSDFSDAKLLKYLPELLCYSVNSSPYLNCEECLCLVLKNQKSGWLSRTT